MYSIHIDDIRWPIPDFISDSINNVCSIPHHFRDIHKIIKCKSFDLENEGQGHDEK